MSDTESYSATAEAVDMDCDYESASMETELTEDEIFMIAEGKKEEGNELYKQKKYKEATSLYTEAIRMCPNCAAYYGNRAAAYLMLTDYGNALNDSRMSTKLDPTYVKGYIREGKCHIAMGNTVAALNVYNIACTIDPNNRAVKDDIKAAECLQNLELSIEKDLENHGDTRRALFYINKCLDQCPKCIRYKVKKAEILSLLGKQSECQDIILGVLQMDSMNADALYVRGVSLYYSDMVDKAFQHFQQVLRLSPDHTKSKEFYKRAKQLIKMKEDGNQAFRIGKLTDAYKIYSEALAIDPHNKSTNAKLYFNRATVASKMSKVDEAITDCSNAIGLDDKYLKAYLRRAKCYMDSEQYEEAVRDYETAYKMDNSKENSRLVKEAKFELKKSKRKDYYKILGVTKVASDDEIKKAYKKRALIHHPDRHSHSETKVQKEEETKFKEVGEAYGVLSDAKKRARYDQGQDLEEIEGAGFDHVDPDLIFQSFFGGGAGMPGGFQFHSSFPSNGGQSFTYHFG